MKIFYHPDCDLNFENYGIEIPIVDDRAFLVFLELKKYHPNLEYFSLEKLPQISKQDLLRVHHKDFVEIILKSDPALYQVMMNCYELLDQNGNFNRYNPSNAKYSLSHARDIILRQVSLFYASTLSALECNFAFFLGGGMHHAMSFGGRGFCLINDSIIIIRKLQAEKKIKHAWVIDVDAHKGDGTAEITKEDPSISTLSIHMRDGWPLNSGNRNAPWFIANDIDIEIAEKEEDLYLAKLEKGLEMMEQNYPHPDLVIIVDGADPYEKDLLPSTSLLKLTLDQLFLRDKLVYQFFKKRNIPMSFCMAGGYGPSSWEVYFQFLHFVGQESSKGTEISSR